MDSKRFYKTSILVAVGILLTAAASGLSAPQVSYYGILAVVLIGSVFIWKDSRLFRIASRLKAKRRGELGSSFEGQRELAIALGAIPSEVTSVHHVDIYLQSWMSNPGAPLPKKLPRKRKEVVNFLARYGKAKTNVMGNSVYAHLHRKGFDISEIASLSLSDESTVSDNLTTAGLIE